MAILDRIYRKGGRLYRKYEGCLQRTSNRNSGEEGGRVSAALAARRVLGEDFFGGWVPEDVELFRTYRVDGTPTNGQITDFLGVKTSVDLVPWAESLGGTWVQEVAIPDDSVHAEAIEYFALLHSLENTRGNSFTLVELGAAYGPWICSGGVLARRSGKKLVRLVAVEASSFMYKLIERHLADNDIGNTAGLDVECEFDVGLFRGAVATDNQTLYFPVVNNAAENGGQVASETAKTDYIGRQVEYEEVPGMKLLDVLPAQGLVDLLHLDIQGSESEVIRKDIALLNERVRYMFVGTHSRRIEGEIIDCLSENEWVLLRERPTKFTFRPEIDTAVGMTTRDGGQYWSNPRNALAQKKETID